MLFKHQEDEAELLKLDVGCIYVLEQLRLFAACVGAPSIVITEILRDNPASVHHYGRGIDIRLRPMTLDQAEQFAEWVNKRLSYGNGKNVVIVGKFDPNGRHDDHIHIQAPGDTVLFGKIPFVRR